MENLRFKQLTMMGLILFALLGCQEEEFYEKEIDGAIEKFERENRTVEEDDAAEQANDDDTTNDNNDDDNNDDDNNDDDNNDDDNNDDDNNDDDNNDDDNNDDDNNDDDNNDDDNNDDQPALSPKSDSFTQKGSNAKTDILWVVDNSGSMADEQQALATNFKSFIEDFASKNIDFQMAITTTDRANKGRNQVQKDKDIMADLNSASMISDKDKFISNFKKHIKVGTRGSGYEKGLKSSEVFANIHKNDFIREDAYLAIVYVTDERDQSEKTVQNHLKGIQKWKKNNGLIRAYSIVDMDNLQSTRYILKGYDRYKEMSDSTNGSVANLYDNFHSVLSNIGSSIAQLTEEFPLSTTPYNFVDITVKVNGFTVVEWDYIEASNTIKFHSNAIPADGASIEVIYNVED